MKAHVDVARAIRNGDLVRQPCEDCGSTLNVVAHHDDYAKPLKVRWLCPAHHSEWHRHNVAANRPPQPPRREITDPIGHMIAAARVGSGLTQFELAQKVGVNVWTVSSWERNEHEPSLKMLREVAAATDRDPGWFLS